MEGHRNKNAKISPIYPSREGKYFPLYRYSFNMGMNFRRIDATLALYFESSAQLYPDLGGFED